jgi:hypothetical protein
MAELPPKALPFEHEGIYVSLIHPKTTLAEQLMEDISDSATRLPQTKASQEIQNAAIQTKTLKASTCLGNTDGVLGGAC